MNHNIDGVLVIGYGPEATRSVTDSATTIALAATTSTARLILVIVSIVGAIVIRCCGY